MNPDELEVAPGSEREELQGWIPELATPEEIRTALEKAFHYRGDITITRKDGATVEGYLFDRRPGPTLEASAVRILKASGEKLSVPYSDIARLAFSGRDTASGKSWEAWVNKYMEARAAGETFFIQPESLD
ncbi:MAG: hypothetical protein JWP63_5154 [Candidatus Solibacter sp.]|jgi:hypothetical protein|nr:hypothetical protein [Candidatus Solibacter sp.]